MTLIAQNMGGIWEELILVMGGRSGGFNVWIYIYINRPRKNYSLNG